MRAAAAFVFAALLSAAAVALSLSLPYAGFPGETFVDIPRGATLMQTAEALENAGVLRSRWQLPLARLLRPRLKVLAGEYRFDKPASTWEVLRRLAAGDVFYHELVVPEGQNMFDVAASVERLGLMPAETFLAAARDTRLIRDLAPRAPSLEGFLFPDTYRLPRRTPAREVCRMMTERFRRAAQRFRGRADLLELVTLASMVEKESAVPEERALVASVYSNRLKAGVKLDCDPTTIYAAQLEGKYRGVIYRSDLESRHPYNTYQHAGLPPGPIANPGKAALEAAAAPAATRYLYFVAQPGSGGHHRFSESLEQHQKAVSSYRRAQRQNVPETKTARNRR